MLTETSSLLSGAKRTLFVVIERLNWLSAKDNSGAANVMTRTSTKPTHRVFMVLTPARPAHPDTARTATRPSSPLRVAGTYRAERSAIPADERNRPATSRHLA